MVNGSGARRALALTPSANRKRKKIPSVNLFAEGENKKGQADFSPSNENNRSGILVYPWPGPFVSRFVNSSP